jgi:enoyl-CoA hydratase
MTVHYEAVESGVVRITIDRPERRNSLDFAHFHQLARAWSRYAADDAARVAIITGVSGSFCAGADLRDYVPQLTALQERIRGGLTEHPEGWDLRDATRAVLRRPDFFKPIVAAVDGPCLAGGFEMLCGTDVRIASTNASFGVTEASLGLMAGGGTTARLPRQIAYAAAMELLLVAAPVSAERARELGVVSQVVAPLRLATESLALARRIAANAPLAVRATKESVVRGGLVDLEQAYQIERELYARVMASADAREGPAAFAQRRPPVWSGC